MNARDRRLPSGALPRYQPQEWATLVNTCRQPRASYRWALLVPGAESLEGLPGPGAGGRWFLLPVGALLLRREPGQLVGMQDLAARPLELGPFTLRQAEPLRPETARRREELRAVRAARSALRGTRCPAPPAVPNEGRPMRYGPRLVLAVSGRFLRIRRREVEHLAQRFTSGRPGQRGGKGAPVVRLPQGKTAPDLTLFLELVRLLNWMTRELETVAEFAWVDVASLRAWDKTTTGAAVAALTRCGMPPATARNWAEAHVRPWERSKPSASRRIGRR